MPVIIIYLENVVRNDTAFISFHCTCLNIKHYGKNNLNNKHYEIFIFKIFLPTVKIRIYLQEKILSPTSETF